MEMVMTNGFVELSSTETAEIDGGKWHWYDYVITLTNPFYGLSKAIREDLQSQYEYGYIQGRKDSGR